MATSKRPVLRLNPTPDLPPKPTYPDIPARPRTREQCLELGRRHARDRGDKLTPEQIVRLAALVRPHLRREDDQETA